MNTPQFGSGSKEGIFQAMMAAGPGSSYRSLMVLCAILLVIGAGAFLMGISGAQALRAWQAYLTNFLFWTGLSFGAVLFVAVLNMTNARWARSMKRLAESLGAFLPISFLLFWVLYLGREEIFPWIKQPVKGKEVWLNAGFLFARDGLGLLLLTGVAMALLYYSIRGDQAILARTDSIPGGAGSEEMGRAGRNWHLQVVLSPVLGILYALVLSLLAFDLAMSLDPHWYSTLFGAYYFIGSFYSALAALLILSGLARIHMGLERFVQPRHFHDLGKLLLGFCLITGDFFYSQFLVIWYGNLPEETRYVILRVRHSPWEPLAWTVLVVSFAFPFVVLLSRKIKLKPAAMMGLAGIILVGMWLERFLLVAPSLWKGGEFPLGLLEVFITTGFLGVVGLSVLVFFRKFPLLPLSDPLFLAELEEAGVETEAGNPKC